MDFKIIVAIDQNNGIGKENNIPWHLPPDLKHFSQITKTTNDPTKQNAVIMGRKTWDSLPEKYKPLPGRLNVILTTSETPISPTAQQFNSIGNALTALSKNPLIESVFIIGGASIYAQSLNHPNLEKIYLTQIEGTFDCDTFFPEIPANIIKSERISEKLTHENLNYTFKEIEIQRPESVSK